MIFRFFSFYSAYGYVITPAPFVGKAVLLPMNCFGTLKNHLTIFVWGGFLVICSVPLIRVSSPLSTAHGVDHCKFIESLNI